MTPKEELIQALLNTSSISKEAYEILEGIVYNDGGGGGVQIFETELCLVDGYHEYRTIATAVDLVNAYIGGKVVCVHFPGSQFLGREAYIYLISVGINRDDNNEDEFYISGLEFSGKDFSYNLGIGYAPLTYIYNASINEEDSKIYFAIDEG